MASPGRDTELLRRKGLGRALILTAWTVGLTWRIKTLMIRKRRTMMTMMMKRKMLEAE